MAYLTREQQIILHQAGRIMDAEQEPAQQRLDVLFKSYHGACRSIDQQMGTRNECRKILRAALAGEADLHVAAERVLDLLA